MNVNYIKHLESATLRIADDTRLNTTHVSMYLALFVIWNHNRFQNPLSINRSEVMRISKIGARATYQKCINDLHQWGYLKYEPSHNPLKGSLIYLFNLGTSTEQVVSQLGGQVCGQLVSQVLGPSINNIKHNKHINITKGRTDELPFVRDDQKVVPSPKIKIEKFSSPSLEEKAIKLSKTEARTGSSNSRGTAIDLPNLEQVKEFFKSKNKTDLDAEKFFNHFESNGWLVGGKSKMKDWKAAARNWILRSQNFAAPAQPIDRLNTEQNKDYSIPL